MRVTIIIALTIMLGGCASKEIAMGVMVGFIGSKYCKTYDDGVWKPLNQKGQD